jgi:transcriptional regulator with XRE-family HTH domain
MAGFGSPLVPRRRLAAELGRLRKEAGLTGAEVARQLHWSASKVSRYELARTGLKPDEVARLLDVYQVTGATRAELLMLATEGEKKKRGWWDAYSDVLPDELSELIGLENEARSALTWQIECVPGLLQTRRYAQQVNRSYQQVAGVPPGLMERRVQARMLRQQVLSRTAPLQLSAVIDESALRRGVADPAVMREQLEYLVEVSGQPNVAIRVLPLAASLNVIHPSFVVLEFGRSQIGGSDTLPDVAYAEHLVTNLYFDDEEITYAYKEAFRQLESAALSESDARGLIRDVAQQAWA